MIEWDSLPPGNHRVECPICARGPKDRTCGVTVEHDGRGIAHCFRCDYAETHRVSRPTIRPGKAIPRPVAGLKRDRLSEWGMELWERSTGLRGTVGEKYLLSRRCVLPPADGDLRFHPALKHPSGHVGPALVALVTHAETGEPLTLHRTWITPTGKANVEPPRLLLGGHRKQGGVIRLWPDESVTYSLAIAEGIETALSLAHAHAPAWSLIDAGNLGSIPVLRGVECLVIGADHDEAGLQAATACADRWAASGVEVRVVAPREHKTDLNDVVLGRAPHEWA